MINKMKKKVKETRKKSGKKKKISGCQTLKGLCGEECSSVLFHYVAFVLHSQEVTITLSYIEFRL